MTITGPALLPEVFPFTTSSYMWPIPALMENIPNRITVAAQKPLDRTFAQSRGSQAEREVPEAHLALEGTPGFPDD